MMAGEGHTKRALLTEAGLMLAALGMADWSTAVGAAVPSAAAFQPTFPGQGPIPWIKRIFHLYSGPDGLTQAEQLPVVLPPDSGVAQLLRRTAERVTIGGAAPHAGYDFHVANQPTLLIPLFGSMIIELADGKTYELVHGDLAIAEDCTGKGHISRSGPQGSFMVSVQLPKAGCPAQGSSDVNSFWRD